MKTTSEYRKHIVREIPADRACLDWYFEDDGLTERGGGDFCDNLFILYRDRDRLSGFNVERYADIQADAFRLQDYFSEVKDGIYDPDGKRVTYKDIMQDFGIPYSSRRCHALKEWAEMADVDDADSIAEYLTIITGKTWATSSAYGYYQGDYVEMVYCPERYRDGVQAYGEVWLGAAKEFCVIDLGENGEEIDGVGGYIVADCQAATDEDYKKLVCNWAGIPEDETQLELIDDAITTTSYTYRIA